MTTLGIIGCGQLGGAIARAVLRAGVVPPERLWIANRSGSHAGFEPYERICWTTDVQALADSCDTLLLALPPAAGSRLEFRAAGRLVVSVMAGVTTLQLGALSGSQRVVRAMSNPAADISLAYSPWFATPAVTDADRVVVRALFQACGVTDEVDSEDQIDVFTAITGPAPGFVAFFADCMIAYARQQGVAPAIADRAIRQLFLASGQMLAASPATPGADVQAMIDYAGTTAAGLDAMKASGMAALIAQGLEAARVKTLAIGKPPGTG